MQTKLYDIREDDKIAQKLLIEDLTPDIDNATYN